MCRTMTITLATFFWSSVALQHLPFMGKHQPSLHFSHSTDEFLEAATSREFSAKLNEWKAAGKIELWNSTLLNIVPSTTRIDVQLISRTSFSSNDYFSETIQSMRKSQEQFSFQPLFISLCIVSFLFGSFVVPLLTVPVALKNTLGLASLFAPFTLLLLLSIAPELYTSLLRRYLTTTTKHQKERVIAHEAGHLLAGYICGVVIRDYDVTGDRDAGTTVELGDTNHASLKNNLGLLLIVSFSGVVAESLIFGDSRGGADDIRMAMELLHLSRIPTADYEGSLRWAVMKSLVLLRLHRDSLDELICAMHSGNSITECIQRIEDAHRQSK
jgi:hypothetical protein